MVTPLGTSTAAGSARDVRVLTHASVEMNERYIDGDTRRQRRVVGLL
jgi:hypothetical protein